MKMNQKGISTALLVAIPIIIVVAVVVPVVVVVAVKSGGGAGGLPVYSGASEFKSTESGQTKSTYYDLGTANLSDVYNWYKTEMPSQGWTLTQDASQGGAYDLKYSKGADSAEVVIVAGTVEGYSANKILVLAFTAGTTPG